VPGDDPFALTDPGFEQRAEPVNLYTWPSDLPEATIDGSVEPVSPDVIWRAGRGDIVRELRPGAWTVNGNAAKPYSYLLQWGDAPIARGAVFVVRGALLEGGVQIGFLQQNEWVSYVVVAREGPFEAIIEIQKPGQYALVVANCVTASWWERARRHWLSATLSLVRPGFLPNRFYVSQAGWARRSS
jgi:hypothetical protein